MLNRLIEKLARALDSLEIPYMIVGGQAVLVFGEPRLTKDIDLILGLAPDSLPKVMKLVEMTGIKILVEDPENFVSRTFVLPAKDQESGFRIDIVFSNSEYERQAIDRAVKMEINGVAAKFTTPEDLVIQKIVAGRERDLDDAKKIIAKNTGLDREYISHWLNWFGQVLASDLIKIYSKMSSE